MNTEETFWSKVERRGPDDCWPWKGHLSRGYGYFSLFNHRHTAHRVAFFFTYGHWPTPIGRHTCDNPPCCNPRHIIEGTQLDNARDRDERGRREAPKGERNSSAKLTDADVAVIRSTHHSLGSAALARRFSVHRSTIIRIVSGKSRTTTTQGPHMQEYTGQDR